MGGSLTSPKGKYLERTTFSDLYNYPGMAVNKGSSHLEKKVDNVRVQGKGMYELFYRQKKVTLGTAELLNRLESTCKDSLVIIKNIRSQKDFEKDDGLKEYIEVIMKETEEELRAYNDSVTTKESKERHPLLEMERDVGNPSQEPIKISIPSKINDAFHHESKSKAEPDIQSGKATKAEEIQSEMKRLKDDIKQLASDNERCRKEYADLKGENAKYSEKIKQLEDEVTSLNYRLSKLASDKLSENNPAIADLSDSNRPTKLGEQYKELYDNEWTDAFEALENNAKKGTEAIDILLKTLQNVSDFCSRKAELFLKETDKTIKKLFESEILSDSTSCESTSMKVLLQGVDEKVRNTMYAKDKPVLSGEISMSDMQLYMKWEKPDSCRHGSAGKTAQSLSESQNVKMANIISSLRKEIGFSVLSLVKRAYLSPGRWSLACIPELEPYIEKCAHICWMMVVQRPPMCFISDHSRSTKSQMELWKPYTQSGTEIDYVVWPPLLLHADGPLVADGVAQYKKV